MMTKKEKWRNPPLLHYLICRLIASKLSGLITCSILQASSVAISSGTPSVSAIEIIKDAVHRSSRQSDGGICEEDMAVSFIVI